MMRVAVLGATGVIGRHVVRAAVRGDANARVVRGIGIDAVQSDILDSQSLRQAVVDKI
jgi:uncharacterized protein YbjT (DUF2867 family)